MRKISETYTQLKKICQRPDSYHRIFSLPITRLLIKFKFITPTQITVIDFFVGLSGSLLLFFGTDLTFLLGTLLLQLFEVLDCVDGEIARFLIYKKELQRSKRETKIVEFIQDIIHPIIQPLMYLGFSYGLYQNYPHRLLLIAGYIAAIGTSVDTYTNILREKLIGSIGLNKASRVYKQMKQKTGGLLHRLPFHNFIVEFLTFITPIPGVITILNLSVLLDLVVFGNAGAIFIYNFPMNFKIGVLIGYSILQQLLWMFNAIGSLKNIEING